MQRIRILAQTTLVLLLAASVSAQDANLREEYGKLLKTRSELMEQWSQLNQADVKKGPQRHFHLRFAEGADGHDAWMVARMAGGSWRQSSMKVPAWSQSTMQEWRGFHLANGAGCTWRHGLRFPARFQSTTIDADKLAATAEVTYRLDETLDEQLPPGEAHGWWDRFIPTGFMKPRKQTYDFDVKIHDDAAVLDLVLEGGVRHGSRKRRKRASVNIKPIFVRLQVPATRFTTISVSTPTWNGGFHEGDATGLAFKDGKLSGTLKIFLHHDGWVPYKGKRSPQPPLEIEFVLDARLDHHVLSGTYHATGDMGKYEGKVRGRGGKAVIGRFKSSGEIDERVGRVDGFLLDDLLPPEKLLADIPALPDDDRKAAVQAAGDIEALYRQIRALHLAIQHYPLPISEAMAQVDTAVADLVSDLKPEAVAAYVQAVRQAVEAAGDPQSANLPEAVAEGAGDSPSTNLKAVESVPGINRLSEDSGDGWYFLPQWYVIGPFEQRLGLEHNTGLVPGIIPAPILSYTQPRDRMGAAIENPRAVQWKPMVADNTTIAPPWEKNGFYNRFRGETWYASAWLEAPKATDAWLSLEACEQAKVWLNGRLIWTDEEKPYRYRLRGREFVKVSLKEGRNEILIRSNRDRRPSWVRLAMTLRKPHTAKVADPADKPFVGERVFPDAQPPLAWDIEKGINVAWRNTDMGGRTRPLVVGNSLFLTDGVGRLLSLDLATGKPNWTGEVSIFELLASDKDRATVWKNASAENRSKMMEAAAREVGFRYRNLGETRASDPVTDGKHVWMHAGGGVAACFDLDGERKWAIRTDLQPAKVHQAGELIVLEGEITESWPVPKDLQKLREGKKPTRMVGVLVLSAEKGEVKHRLTMPGEFRSHASVLLEAASKSGTVRTLYTSTGRLVDVADGKLRSAMNVERPGDPANVSIAAGYANGGGYALCSNADTVFMTAQEQLVAVRLWDDQGRLAYGHRWEANYEHSGFGSFSAPSVATEKYVFVSQPILDRGPHCPDARLEVLAYDAKTGQALGKLKPSLEQAVRHGVMPVVAGKYLFTLDSGGGSHGGHPTHGQIAITSADGDLQLISRNLVDIGTDSPVFAGKRMILRSGRALTCIAVTTEEGRDYQARRLAKVVLEEVGAPPTTAEPKRIQPVAAEELQLGPDMPVGLLRDGRTPDRWIGAGPFPATGDADAPADNAYAAGDAVTWRGKKLSFRPLSRKYAHNNPPAFIGIYSLQGTGEIVPSFSSRVDPSAVANADSGLGLLQTVLDNTRDRIVVLTCKDPDVTQYLCGTKLQPDQPLRLAPGLYPLMVVVRPEHFRIEKPKILQPVAVDKALQAGALKDIAWPGSWQVFGPLPPDMAPLKGRDLKEIPKKISVGDRDFPAFEIPAREKTVLLTSLVDLRPGQKPDVENAPDTVKIGVPSMAYAFAKIKVPEDGRLYIQAGADWFMRWYLDGEKVYDTLSSGNGAPPTDMAHPFAVDVSKGEHVLAVQVKPGSRGWSFTATGGFAPGMTDKLAEFKVASRIKIPEPDFRLNPAMKVIPHPPTRMKRYLRRLRARRDRLQAIIEQLPDSPEAATARKMLAQLED